MPSPHALSLDRFIALPRLAGLCVHPSGDRLALTIQSVAKDAKRFAGSVWEVPTGGDGTARRLTWSNQGETARGYLPDGSLVFTSARPDPADPDPSKDGPEALWVLPANGGEARRVFAPGGGVAEVAVAPCSSTCVVRAPLHPGPDPITEDEARDKARRDAGVVARLVEHYPDRFWDHDLGPRVPHLVALDLDATGPIPPPRDLVPSPPWPGWLEDGQMALNRDGTRLAFAASPKHGAAFKKDLAVVGTDAGADWRVVVDRAEGHGAIAWSPDGGTLAVSTEDVGAPGVPMRFHLRLIDASTGEARDLVPEWEGWALEIEWAPAGDCLYVVADERGRVPVFRVGLDGRVTRLTADGSYHDLAVAPDGAALYAIRAGVAEPPVAVAIDPHAADQEPRVLGGPAGPVETGTRVEEVNVTAADGTAVHGWLVLPDGDDGMPRPLAVLIHGGPFAAWSAWSWRWNPALFAARGWAVLLPNPRLSTGYGHHHVASAWGDWATLPSGDILTLVDAVVAREDIDAERTAALGGSYGGYMANWLAVTTDRFRAIVTHASVWDLFMERGTSDLGQMLDHEFGDPVSAADHWRAQSPHTRADALRTPMLVIHGERDQRVGLGNAFSLWTELQVRGVPSRMLIFRDENHWILQPQNTRVWYETVFAFLDEHVLGEPWRRPALL